MSKQKITDQQILMQYERNGEYTTRETRITATAKGLGVTRTRVRTLLDKRQLSRSKGVELVEVGKADKAGMRRVVIDSPAGQVTWYTPTDDEGISRYIKKLAARQGQRALGTST